MTSIERKMSGYRKQTEDIAQQAKTIEKQMEALARIKFCVACGSHGSAKGLSIAAWQPALYPLHGLSDATIQCEDCYCHCVIGVRPPGECEWMVPIEDGPSISLREFLKDDEEESVEEEDSIEDKDFTVCPECNGKGMTSEHMKIALEYYQCETCGLWVDE